MSEEHTVAVQKLRQGYDKVPSYEKAIRAQILPDNVCFKNAARDLRAHKGFPRNGLGEKEAITYYKGIVPQWATAAGRLLMMGESGGVDYTKDAHRGQLAADAELLVLSFLLPESMIAPVEWYILTGNEEFISWYTPGRVSAELDAKAAGLAVKIRIADCDLFMTEDEYMRTTWPKVESLLIKAREGGSKPYKRRGRQWRRWLRWWRIKQEEPKRTAEDIAAIWSEKYPEDLDMTASAVSKGIREIERLMRPQKM